MEKKFLHQLNWFEVIGNESQVIFSLTVRTGFNQTLLNVRAWIVKKLIKETYILTYWFFTDFEGLGNRLKGFLKNGLVPWKYEIFESLSSRKIFSMEIQIVSLTEMFVLEVFMYCEDFVFHTGIDFDQTTFVSSISSPCWE